MLRRMLSRISTSSCLKTVISNDLKPIIASKWQSNGSAKKHIDYKVQPVQSIHIPQAINVLSDGFTNRTEPLFYGCNIQHHEILYPFSEWLLTESLKPETSNIVSVAVENDTNKVIGVCGGNDYVIDPPQELMQKLHDLSTSYNGNLQMLFDLHADLEEEYNKIKMENNEYEQGKIFHIWVSSVHKDYQRCGVVTSIQKNILETVRRKSYKYALSEASNLFSQNKNLKIGFKIENEIKYKDWEYPKQSNQFPLKCVVQATGFHKLCLMVYSL